MKTVVEFPKHKIVRQAPINIEVLERAKEKAVTTFGDSVTDAMIDALLEGFENWGIDTEKPQFIRDFSFTVDAIRATVYRSIEMDHPLHKFIDENVKMINRETGEPIEIEDLMNDVDTKD
jgi:hypothetical protein